MNYYYYEEQTGTTSIINDRNHVLKTGFSCRGVWFPASKRTGSQTVAVGVAYTSESVLQELSERGVAVVPNVLTPTECDHYVAQYKSWLDKFSSMGVELNSMMSLIGSYRVAHFDVTWEVRLKTKPVFEKLWKTEKLLTSADAIAVSRPPEEDEDYNMPDEDWLHLDQGAQKQGLHAFQGAVYLEETTDTDYCFRVLEDSHNYNSSFLEKFPRVADISTKAGTDLITLNYSHIQWFKSKGCTQTKVPCPKGGMILWDSRTVHDNCKPEFGRPNKDRWRFVVFVSMTPAIWAKPHDIEKKQEAYEKLLQTNHWSSQTELCKTRRGEPLDQRVTRDSENKGSEAFVWSRCL